MKGTFVGRGEKQAKVNRRYLAEDIIMSYWRAEVFLRVYISSTRHATTGDGRRPVGGVVPRGIIVVTLSTLQRRRWKQRLESSVP
jgi:hypothetical protein